MTGGNGTVDRVLQVISACGVGKSGSIRVVRNGIGIEEQAHVELPGITGIWSLRDDSSAIHDRYLVQSFAHETRILAISEEAMEEVEDAPGLSLTSQSLLCANVMSDLVVQVTPTEVRVFRPSRGFELVSSWTAVASPSVDAHARITVAASCGPHVLLAMAGGHVLHLRVEPAGTLIIGASATMPHEIACLSVHMATVQDDASSGVLFVGVGLWTDISVRLLRLAYTAREASLQEVARQHLGGEIQSR
jgi:DNA damage-binding protein 1